MSKNSFFALLNFICSTYIYVTLPTIEQIRPAVMLLEIAPNKAPFYIPSFERPNFGDRILSIVNLAVNTCF